MSSRTSTPPTGSTSARRGQSGARGNRWDLERKKGEGRAPEKSRSLVVAMVVFTPLSGTASYCTAVLTSSHENFGFNPMC